MKKKYPVDHEKLKKVIRKRGLTLDEVSMAISGSRTYLSNSKKSGGLSRLTLYALKNGFGIEYEDIKPDSPKNFIQPELFGGDEDKNDVLKEILAILEDIKSNNNCLCKITPEMLKKVIKEAWQEL